MKTSVSIPDDIFQEAEALAHRANRSRSDLYARALNEYVARHAPDWVTETMNHVLSEADEPHDEFGARAARQMLDHTEW